MGKMCTHDASTQLTFTVMATTMTTVVVVAADNEAQRKIILEHALAIIREQHIRQMRMIQRQRNNNNNKNYWQLE